MRVEHQALVGGRRGRSLVAVLVVLALLPACSPTESAEPSAADTCLAEAPDCEDTFTPADDLPTNEPERGVPVADVVPGAIDGAFEVRGFFFADELGARVCETLLESFPPQCGGASLPVGDFQLEVPVTSQSGVTWSPDVVLLEGEVVGGIFQPLR